MDAPTTPPTTAHLASSSNSNPSSAAISTVSVVSPAASASSIHPPSSIPTPSVTAATTATKNISVPNDADAFRRLLELKQLWISQKKEMFVKGKKRSANGPMELQEKPKRKRRKMSHDKSIEKIVELVREVIEEQGGSCHLETLVEHLRRQWHTLSPPSQSQGDVLDDDASDAPLSSTSNDTSLTVDGEGSKEPQATSAPTERGGGDSTDSFAASTSSQPVDPRDIKRQLKYLLQHHTVKVAGAFVGLFSPDPQRDGCWILNPEAVSPGTTELHNVNIPAGSLPATAASALELLSAAPQTSESGSLSRLPEPKPEYNVTLLDDVMTWCFETHGGTCTADVVCEWVRNHWDRRAHPRSLALSDEQIRERVRIALDSHPKYMKDMQNPNKYFLTNRKKRRGPAAGTTKKSNGNNVSARETILRRRKGMPYGDEEEMSSLSTVGVENSDATKAKQTPPATVSGPLTLSGSAATNERNQSGGSVSTPSHSVAIATGLSSSIPSSSTSTPPVVASSSTGPVIASSSIATATASATASALSSTPSTSVSASASASASTTVSTTTPITSTTTTTTTAATSGMASISSSRTPRPNTLQPSTAPVQPSDGCKCRQCQRTWSKDIAEAWYYGPGPQDWWCAACGVQWAKEHACPVCGRVYDMQTAMPDFVPPERPKRRSARTTRRNTRHRRRRRNSEDEVESDLDEYFFNGEDGISDEQGIDTDDGDDLHEDDEIPSDDESTDSEWIQCDLCGRWVMCKCDGIEDLSLYDDENPNHLPYSCPICRGTLKQIPLVFTHTSQRRNNKLLLLAHEAEIDDDTDTATKSSHSASLLPPGLVRVKMKMRDDHNNNKLTTSNTALSPAPIATARSATTTTTGSGRGRKSRTSLSTGTSSDLIGESPESAIARLSKVSMLDKGANPECKLVQAEKELLRQYEARKTALTQALTEKDERLAVVRLKLEKVGLTEKKFAEEITKVREYLSLTRSALWERNQREFERQLDKLKKEKRLLDEKIEQNLVDQFRSYVQKKQELLQTYVEHILTRQESTETS
jgi:hypothetical protein